MNANKFDLKRIEKGFKEIMLGLGLDLADPSLKDTPRRVAEMYNELFAGLHADPEKLIKKFKTEEYNEIILVKDIPLYSMCEHHFIPFIGKAHVGYIPKNGIYTGLSKIARVVDMFARRPQVQERLTQQIADTLLTNLKPKGVIVVIEAEHLCMCMRGIKKPGSTTVTSALRGAFQKSEKTRMEALKLIFK
ncbi:MAG: GTP cyclohydrolase I FolE [Spirochaetes bacterium]|nr:GTP cyclohydrolase I FolE [Spirochaetota bacterium]